MKKVLLAAALVAALIPMAVAQGNKNQSATINENIQVHGTATVMSSDWKVSHPPVRPSYCNPCLSYSGDFNPNNSNANGLSNENDLIIPDSHIYTPFLVENKNGATVTGLFVNSLDTVGVEDPAQDPWDIRQFITNGNGGKDIATGTAKSTDTPTGRTGFGLTEYTHLVTFQAVTLPKGKYFLNVTPQCTNQNDGNCDNARYYESDEEDNPPINHVGSCKNVDGDSFWNSTTYGETWAGPLNANYCGAGCDNFSDGVIGTWN